MASGDLILAWHTHGSTTVVYACMFFLEPVTCSSRHTDWGTSPTTMHVTLYYLLAIGLSPFKGPNVHRCWPRAPAKSRSVGVEVWRSSRGSESTTPLPTLLKFAGVQHRCTPGLVDGPRPMTTRETNSIMYIVVGDVSKSLSPLLHATVRRRTYMRTHQL